MTKYLRITLGPGLAATLLALCPATYALSPSPPLPVEVLTDFYEAMNGDDWHRNDGWLDPEVEVCDWYGIICVTEGVEFGGYKWVGRIELPDNNLHGELSAELLERMGATHPVPTPSVKLDLSGNAISGQLASLPAARAVVDLGGNRISGALPPFDAERQTPKRIVLARNRFTGRLPDSLGDMAELVSLDLSGNAFTGSIPESWAALDALRSLDLSRSALIGTLPEALLGMESLTEVRLAGNELVGELPEWVSELALQRLDLSNNSLSGPVRRAFEALDPDQARYLLHLTDNELYGPLPDDFEFERFNTPHMLTDFADWGLDLCWNPIDAPPPALLEIIEEFHRGHDLGSCIGRKRMALDAGISGSWFQPQRSGEGLTQMMLPDGTVLVFWFTYRPDNRDEGQVWYMGMAAPGSEWVELRPLVVTTRGRFGEGLDPDDGRVRESSTWMRLDRLGPDRQQFYYQRTGEGICLTGMCSYEAESQRLEHIRLTRLAGTTCDNQRPRQWISGLWHDPERSADGFVVEVNEDGRGVVYWFTHTADGSGDQAWMSGDGHFDGNTLHVDNLIQPRGGSFGEMFDPDLIERTHWGSLTIEFHDDMNAHVHYDSVFAEYGSGDYPLERLARPMLAECD